MGAGPTASQKARSPLPKVPCDKAVLREACSWEPLAVREESVCAVGAAAAEALGCRPGWHVCGPVGRWPGCRVSGQEAVVGGLGPWALSPRGSWTQTPTARRPCRGVGRGVAGATPSLPGEGGEPSGLGRVGGVGRPWPAALVWGSPLMAQGPGLRPLGAECRLVAGVTLLGYHLPWVTAGPGAFLGW